MTTATLVTGNRTMTEVRPRRSLEELVDRLMAALFREETETAEPSARRSTHEARRLRQAEDLEGTLAVLAGVDAATATTREARWPTLSGWTSCGGGSATGASWSTARGRAAALAPRADGSLEAVAVLGMRWQPGKVVSRRILRGLRPLNGGA